MSESQSTILLTGGSGFLGSQVLRTLQAQGGLQRVLIAGRGKPPEDHTRRPSVQYWPLNLANQFVLPTGVHTVIHIAGEKRDESRMDAVNHHGTLRLVEAAEQANVCRFVYVSSVGVYGARPHAGVVTELFPHTPRNRYEVSKDAAEEAVRKLCLQSGMEFLILQPSNVIGVVPGRSYPLLGLMRMVQQGRFTWFGAGDTWVNYVAVEDVAAAVVKAADKAPSGQTFIINTPERLSEVVRWISEELGVPVPSRRLPLWVGEAAATLGSLTTRVSGRNLPINRERFLELTNTTQYDSSHLMKDLAFEYPVGVEVLIRGLARSYRQDRLL
jgi:dihydroflavonol-4-reductase